MLGFRVPYYITTPYMSDNFNETTVQQTSYYRYLSLQLCFSFSDPKHGFLNKDDKIITLKMCYQNDLEFATLIRMFISLKWVPVESVRKYFGLLLKSDLFKKYRKDLQEFKNYFRVSFVVMPFLFCNLYIIYMKLLLRF